MDELDHVTSVIKIVCRIIQKIIIKIDEEFVLVINF